MPRSLITITSGLLLAASTAASSVFIYECDVEPTAGAWEIVQIWCNPAQWLDNGWYFQHVELCEGYPPPGGQQAAYKRALEEFVGVPTFWLEFRVETDADRSEIPWGGGAALAAGSLGPAGYRFFIARDQVRFHRDNSLPILWVDIEPWVPHTFRLELYGAQQYIWYIDGQVIDQSVPEAPYPSSAPSMTWLAKAAWLQNTTKWDYIRYGTIPADHSGDFDSDADVDDTDLYFFVDCLLGPDYDATGPGCRWADLNADGAANAADIQLFTDAMLAP